METTPADPAQPGPGMKRGGVELADSLDHEPDQMILGQPVRHRRRQQKRLVTIDRPIPLRHPPMISNMHKSIYTPEPAETKKQQA
ncbi:hypothetical protein ACFQV6_44230, partial [Actinoplanes sp. GCM10030250]